jgi:hypothetical protein
VDKDYLEKLLKHPGSFVDIVEVILKESDNDIQHRVTGFFGLENTTFQKLDLFLSSGERGDTYSLGSFRKS